MSPASKMNYIRLFASLLIASVIAAEADPEIGTADSTFLDRKVRCVLKLSDLRRAPGWDGESAPPVSPKLAKANAVEAIYTRLGAHPNFPVAIGSNFHGWVVGRTALLQHLDTQMWYYKIEASPVTSGSSGYAAVTVFVTMDGKVSPIIERK